MNIAKNRRFIESFQQIHFTKFLHFDIIFNVVMYGRETYAKL